MCIETQVAFYASGSDNQLASTAAEDALRFLSGFLGPSILRGRVEQSFFRNLAVLDDLLERPSSVSGDSLEGGRAPWTAPPAATYQTGAAAPVAIPGGHRPTMPSLGGTPT